jgi:hypothetical protein
MRALISMLAVAAADAQTPFHQKAAFEQRPVVTIANDKLELAVNERGGAFVNLVLRDDAERLSPLWNPVRNAREAGEANQFGEAFGHFVCVDGFGPGSAEEQAAGLPGHGEAYEQTWEILQSLKDGDTGTLAFHTHLPLVHENFARTLRMVDGENVIYVESALESELAFDRPVSWAEHATIGSPFLQSGVTVSSLSGSRAQSRPYQETVYGAMTRRLAPGRDFTWPLAPGLHGESIDLTAPPENAHYLDHATVLVDPGLRLGWIASVNTAKRLIIGYVFKREDFPWVQNWGSYPPTGKFARGLEFSTQPYDEPRREAVAKNGMFGAPAFRWLSAKSILRSNFLLFYAHTPEGFGAVVNLRLENGQIIIGDAAGKRITLRASLPL